MAEKIEYSTAPAKLGPAGLEAYLSYIEMINAL